MPKNTEILKHYHPPQKREIKSTSEVLVVLEGELRVDIFNGSRTYSISKFKMVTSSMISGGHGIYVESDCRFIEVKRSI